MHQQMTIVRPPSTQSTPTPGGGFAALMAFIVSLKSNNSDLSVSLMSQTAYRKTGAAHLNIQNVDAKQVKGVFGASVN